MEYSIWSLSVLRSIAPDLLLLAALVLLIFRLIKAAPAAAARSKRVLSGSLAVNESGAAAVEFLLIFPILLTLWLTTLQVALVVQGKLIVNYAAFSAARSAMTAISARASSTSGRFEESNQVALDDPDSPKMTMIRRAAAFACLSISPVMSPELVKMTGILPDSSLIAPMAQLAALFPAHVDGKNISQQLVLRAHYSYDRANTKLEIFGDNENRSGVFGEHEKITVRLTYRYLLTVPFANRLLGKSFYGYGFLSSSGWYLPITDQYTIINDGERVFPPHQEHFLPKEGDLIVED